MPRKKKYKVELDNSESLRGLLQETYNDACSNIVEAQGVINEINNSTEPVDVDDYTKIAKSKIDSLKVKESSMKVKLEVSKIMKEIMKDTGKANSDADAAANGSVSLDDFKAIREMISKKSKPQD